MRIADKVDIFTGLIELNANVNYALETEAEIFDRLDRERECIESFMAKGESVSLGGTIPVVFNNQVVDDLDIYRYGRADLDSGLSIYFACPQIDRTPNYKFKETKMFEIRDVQDAYRTMEFDEPYVPPQRLNPLSYFSKIEHIIFEKFNKDKKIIVAVDPSLGTYNRVVKHGHMCYFTPDFDSSYIVNQSHWDASYLIRSHKLSYYYYFGSNGKHPDRNYVKEMKWFSIFADPTSFDFPFDKFRYIDKDRYCQFTYRRHDSDYIVGFNAPYLLDPTTVREHFGCDRGVYIKSSWSICPVIGGSGTIRIGYMPDIPPFIDGISSDTNYIYDVDVADLPSNRRRIMKEIAKRTHKKIHPWNSGNNILYWDSIIKRPSEFELHVIDGDCRVIIPAGFRVERGNAYVPKDRSYFVTGTQISGAFSAVFGNMYSRKSRRPYMSNAFVIHPHESGTIYIHKDRSMLLRMMAFTNPIDVYRREFLEVDDTVKHTYHSAVASGFVNRRYKFLVDSSLLANVDIWSLRVSGKWSVVDLSSGHTTRYLVAPIDCVMLSTFNMTLANLIAEISISHKVVTQAQYSEIMFFCGGIVPLFVSKCLRDCNGNIEMELKRSFISATYVKRFQSEIILHPHDAHDVIALSDMSTV